MITTLLTDYHIVTDEMGLSISDLKDMVSLELILNDCGLTDSISEH